MEPEITEYIDTCPYCDSEVDVWPGPARNHIHIQCNNKKCLVRPHVEGYRPRVIEEWNKRPKQEVLQKENTKLKAKHKILLDACQKAASELQLPACTWGAASQKLVTGRRTLTQALEAEQWK